MSGLSPPSTWWSLIAAGIGIALTTGGLVAYMGSYQRQIDVNTERLSTFEASGTPQVRALTLEIQEIRQRQNDLLKDIQQLPGIESDFNARITGLRLQLDELLTLRAVNDKQERDLLTRIAALEAQVKALEQQVNRARAPARP